MKITPIDIRQQQFGRSFRGLDEREVDSFLSLISDELEAAMKENNRLQEELARSHRQLEDHRDRETALKQTMITAQKVTEDIKDGARKEAEVILSQAEIQAERIIHAANDRLVQIIEDINEVKRQRDQLVSNLTSLVRSHRTLLHEVDEERSEAVFVSIEDLKKARNSLHAQIQELLEAQASLLGLERDRQAEDLKEEVRRLENLRSNLASRIEGILDTHKKLLQAREDVDGRGAGFQVEQNIKVLKRPEAAPASPAPARADENEELPSRREERKGQRSS